MRLCVSLTIFSCLSLSSTSTRIPIISGKNGAPFLSVTVEGAHNNAQLLLVDTGSPHTYLLKHSEYAKLRNISQQRGFKSDQVSRTSVLDTRVLDFVGVEGLVTDTWTRKRFIVGGNIHSWEQKFALAQLPPSQHALWNPKQAGSIGANKNSRFVEKNPVFSFTTDSVDSDDNRSFVFGPVLTSNCRDSIVRFPIDTLGYFWSVRGTVNFGPSLSYQDRELVFDSGTSFVLFPVDLWNQLKQHLLSLNIGSLRSDPKLRMTPFSISKSDLKKISLLQFSLFSGAIKLMLPTLSLVQCARDDCRLLIGKPPSDDDDLESVILGRPFFRALNVEFNASQNTIGICEPVPNSPSNSRSSYLRIDPSIPIPKPVLGQPPIQPPRPPKRKHHIPDDTTPRLSPSTEEPPDDVGEKQSSDQTHDDSHDESEDRNVAKSAQILIPSFLFLLHCIMMILI